MLEKIIIAKNAMWEILRSPKTIAFLKLGASIIAVVHAIDEMKDASKRGKSQIGFKIED